jgi:Ribonuclease G/E
MRKRKPRLLKIKRQRRRKPNLAGAPRVWCPSMQRAGHIIKDGPEQCEVLWESEETDEEHTQLEVVVPKHWLIPYPEHRVRLHKRLRIRKRLRVRIGETND